MFYRTSPRHKLSIVKALQVRLRQTRHSHIMVPNASPWYFFRSLLCSWVLGPSGLHVRTTAAVAAGAGIGQPGQAGEARHPLTPRVTCTALLFAGHRRGRGDDWRWRQRRSCPQGELVAHDLGFKRVAYTDVLGGIGVYQATALNCLTRVTFGGAVTGKRIWSAPPGRCRV